MEETMEIKTEEREIEEVMFSLEEFEHFELSELCISPSDTL